MSKDFLEGSDLEKFEYIGLDYNELSWSMLRITALTNLDDDNMSLCNNQFSIIDKHNCEDRDYEHDEFDVVLVFYLYFVPLV